MQTWRLTGAPRTSLNLGSVASEAMQDNGKVRPDQIGIGFCVDEEDMAPREAARTWMSGHRDVVDEWLAS
jgi:hypothetical protein